MDIMDLEVTKSGKKCLWEQGGGKTNTGRCQIIASAEGRKKKAIFVRRKGELSNSVHALIEVKEKDMW